MMCKWLKDARAVAFSALSRRSQWKRIHHAPQPVIPLVFSAGGGLLDDDDKGALPAPPDRKLLTFRQQLVAEFASRNCAYMGVNGA